MSTLNLTPEEDALVASAVRTKAAQYLAMFGVADPVLDALLAKIEGQLPTPVVEETVVVEEPAPAAAVEAFMDEVPHEQFTEEADKSAESEVE